MAKLMLADDHPLYLDGMIQFLAANNHEIVCVAHSATETIAKISTVTPDILILDVSMKDGTGVDVLGHLRSSGQNLPVIFMTVSIDPALTVEALKYGINGIVLKDSEPAELLKAIEMVLEGESCIDHSVTERALQYSVSDKRKVASREDLLTERERHITELVREGLRNNEIAIRCGLTEGTVKVHLHNIFQKLGVRSRAELIVQSRRDAA
ncbi:response regulator [Aquisediminimonas profunda]|uniref:response regulator n=1 Tax=Aquisediminimonas profunda TaxID=1550733 RepID=UPI001C632537|nr:response regulator transcription factor [Aquisediminimonas profunda]